MGNKQSQKLNRVNEIHFFLFLFEFILLLNLTFCTPSCKGIIDLSDTDCFNDVITFNHDKWRAGHACTNKYGNTIVEFSLNPSNSSKRLFYGLNKKGRYYFPGEPFFKEINTTNCVDCDDNDYRGRFESRNLLVSLYDDTDKNKQYLFSMSTYYSLVELIDIEDRENFNFLLWNVTKFFNLKRTIFSLEFSLFEIGNSNTYITAFIESAGVNHKNEELSNTTTILKFHINSFSETNQREIDNYVILNNTYDGRCVSAFRLDDSKLIVLIFVERTGEKTGNYMAYFYDDNLTYKDKCSIYENVGGLWVGYGIFVKGISVKGDYCAVAFFSSGDSGNTLNFKFMKYDSSRNDKFDYKHTTIFSETFRQDVGSNGFYKLEDDRLALFTTNDYYSIEYGVLHMFLIDFYDDYKGVKIRDYVFYYPEKRFAKEMAAYMYNGYILLTATISDKDQNDMFAIMMIFGFANGTDFEIDISPYLMDTGYYNEENNLYDMIF